jgi:hypothetical protein
MLWIISLIASISLGEGASRVMVLYPWADLILIGQSPKSIFRLAHRHESSDKMRNIRSPHYLDQSNSRYLHPLPGLSYLLSESPGYLLGYALH